MEGRHEPPAFEIRYGRKHSRQKALHVGSAASVEPSLIDPQRKGVAGPRLAIDRNAVVVARERDTAFALGSDGRVERRLLRVATLDAGRADVVLPKIIFDEGDDAEIASVAGRVKGDKTGQQFDRRVNRASRYVHRLPVVVQFMLRRV